MKTSGDVWRPKEQVQMMSPSDFSKRQAICDENALIK